MKKPTAVDDPLRNIQAFVDGTRGQITIGEIPPIRSAVLAAVGKKVRVALVRRDQETVSDFLLRLDSGKQCQFLPVEYGNAQSEVCCGLKRS